MLEVQCNDAPARSIGPLRTVMMARPPWCRDCRHRGTRAFVDLNDDERGVMAKIKEAHAIASAGQILTTQGEPSTYRGVLYSGMAARYRAMGSGRRQLIDIMLAGDLIGFDNEPGEASWSTVEALTDVSVCVFDPVQWDAIITTPSLAARIDQRRLAEWQQMGDRFAAVGACDPARTLAQFILNTHRRLRVRGLGLAKSFTLPLTRLQLSEAVGVTRVHLHRLLRTFRDRQLMTINGQRVSIIDLDELQTLAGLSNDRPTRLALI